MNVSKLKRVDSAEAKFKRGNLKRFSGRECGALHLERLNESRDSKIQHQASRLDSPVTLRTERGSDGQKTIYSKHDDGENHGTENETNILCLASFRRCFHHISRSTGPAQMHNGAPIDKTGAPSFTGSASNAQAPCDWTDGVFMVSSGSLIRRR